MARIPAATRESVPAEQVEEFDRIVESIGRVPPVGPYSALIHSPKALRLADGLNQYLRNESSLSPKTLELAMLVVARELDCQHIWNDHARVARAEGVPDDVITALRDRKPLPPMDDDVAAVINYGQEWFRNRKVGRGAFQAALEQFGNRGVVELTVTMGDYALLAFLVNAFDPDLPPNRTEPLLPG